MGFRERARAWRRWVDPLTASILGLLALGLLLPARGAVGDVLDGVRDGAVVLLFLLYGARMPSGELLRAMRRIRVQGSMLAATFLVFPVLGLAVQLVPDAVLPPEVRRGLLYLSILPSTVQSSVVLTGEARGDVPAALTGATVSNVLGVLATPVLAIALLGAGGTGGAGSVLLPALGMLLAPFVVGQLLQPFVGAWLRAHPRLTRVTDRVTILLVVYTSVSEASTSGAWDDVTPLVLAALLGVCAVLLAIMLSLTWWGGGRLGLTRPERIALLMCGSKKSAATGLPMSTVLFAPAVAAGLALPVIAYHQLQLTVCALLARRLARGVAASAEGGGS
ncbi:bile acid:sodium symporter family protein [Sanguibacter sp. HDW7]|uniref:bile acid:sodium symporter family protein n=1 Tax=Sanguibacter sp. HDW7 TaxID=2714931 RepID=UPI001409DA96|nr:bile acid:sodium symporter family protein [Sanguibacter sp. HDW7]QIK84662.1 bile acid:sodium symporter [Sanguibacter sp. HDW7]